VGKAQHGDEHVFIILLFCGIIDGSRRAADAFMQGQENVSPAQGAPACAVRLLLYVQLDFVHEGFSLRLHDILAFVVIGQTDMWRLWVLASETNQVLAVSSNIQCLFCGGVCRGLSKSTLSYL
jgi:hypothetical protein